MGKELERSVSMPLHEPVDDDFAKYLKQSLGKEEDMLLNLGILTYEEFEVLKTDKNKKKFLAVVNECLDNRMYPEEIRNTVMEYIKNSDVQVPFIFDSTEIITAVRTGLDEFLMNRDKKCFN